MNNQLDSTVSRYMNTIHQLPKLSREQELELCRRWYEHGDVSAKDELISANLRYVAVIALKYRRYGLPLSDLIAEGSIGIMHALTKFEPEREFRFVTYSAYWIRACILSYIIRSWSLVGGGSGALRSKMFFRLRRERVRITNLVGEGEHADQILADRFKVSRDQVVAMVGRLEMRDVSLDTPVYEGGVSTMIDTLASREVNQEEAYSESQSQTRARDIVRVALATLDKRERFIVEKRIMADAEDEMSLAELGRVMNISRERARQLEARAKRKLKGRISEITAGALPGASLVRAA